MKSIDWQVHEALGTDLTGYIADRTNSNSACLVHAKGIKWVDIPKYSSSAEGLVIMLTELRKLHREGFRFDMSFDDDYYFVYVSTTQNPHYVISTFSRRDLAYACCEAFLFIKERQLNDISTDGEEMEG
jgi:hypothetical protein